MKKSKEVPEQVDHRLKVLQDLKMRLRQEVQPDPSDPSIGHVGDMTERYPLLSAAMHAHLYTGGPERGARVTLWGDVDGLGGVFSVPSLGISKFFTASSLQEALQGLEDALMDPDTKWKRDRPQKASRNGYGKSTGRTR